MASKFLTPVLMALLIVIGIFGWIQTASGQENDGTHVLKSETQEDNVRQIEAPDSFNSPNEPNIGFIDSPSVVCYQPDRFRDDCFINWYYLNVSASPNYMIAMTITLNTIGPVARVGGFFQTSMYVPYNMLGNGFKVACGIPGAGGTASLGNAYTFTIRAVDSSNLRSANYGTVYCPAYEP